MTRVQMPTAHCPCNGMAINRSVVSGHLAMVLPVVRGCAILPSGEDGVQ